ERELGGVGGLEWPEKLELDADKIVGPAVLDGHAAFADLVIAGPRRNRSNAGRRAVVGFLHLRIELFPRRPGAPVVKIVDMRKYSRWRRGDRASPHDAEIRRLQGDDDDKTKNDNGDGNQDVDENHGGSSEDGRWWSDLLLLAILRFLNFPARRVRRNDLVQMN